MCFSFAFPNRYKSEVDEASCLKKGKGKRKVSLENVPLLFCLTPSQRRC